MEVNMIDNKDLNSFNTINDCRKFISLYSSCFVYRLVVALFLLILLSSNVSALTPVSSCGTALNVAGEYYILTSNLKSDGTCLTVGANNIVIDGGGYWVNFSNVTSSTYGIDGADSSFINTTIKNITIYKNNSATSSTHSIHRPGTGSTITNVTFNNSLGGSNAFAIDVWRHINFTYNTIIQSGSDGVFFECSSGCESNNNFSFNSFNITSATSGAFRLRGLTNSVVFNNTINTTIGGGIFFESGYSPTGNIIYNNVIVRTSGGTAIGIDAVNANNNKIYNNTIGLVGISTAYYSNSANANVFIDPLFTTNQLTIGTSKILNFSLDNITWMKTNLTASKTFRRTIQNWNKTNITWIENTTSTTTTAIYSIDGLIGTTKYSIFNETKIDYNLTTDINGYLPDFSMGLNTSFKNFSVLVATPNITNPTNNTNQSNNVNLTWDSPQIAWYQVASDSGFTTIVNQSNTTVNYSGAITLPTTGTYYARVFGNLSGVYTPVSPTVQFNIYAGQMALYTPLNGSVLTSNTLSLSWNESIPDKPYMWHLSTDSDFINIVATGNELSTDGYYSISPTMTLTNSTTYYWRVMNSSGTFTNWYNFTTPATPAVPGRLNITVLDEVNYTLVLNFTIELFNSTSHIVKSTNNGWVNFTSSEVASGTYTAIANGNASYAERSLIVISPGNYTMYMPNVNINTIDFVSFYLLDYTSRFPYLQSYITITRGNNISQSGFFDSDAKNAANLIHGSSYSITITNPTTNAIQAWGNFVPTGTGSVQIAIINLGANSSILRPYAQTITRNGNEIDFSWTDYNNVMRYVNITVYKNNMSNLVYTLNTTVKSGTVSYIITDPTAIYYTQMSASTTLSDTIDSLVINLQTVTDRIRTLSYGTFTLPAWLVNAMSIILLFMLGGTFGAMHRGEGAIIVAFLGAYFFWIGWLSMSTAIAGMFGALALLAILYHIDAKRRQGGYF